MGTHRLVPSGVEVLPDPARRWLLEPRPEGWNGWWPVSGAQQAALDSDADVLLLGGAAGSTKTSTMLVDLIRERDYPRMRSYFFRRTYKEMEGGDAAIDQSLQLFPQTGATYNANQHTWTWPSGAQFFFKHCQYEKDVYQYQGHAMSAGAIDESTHWEEKLVRYLLTRNRSTDDGLKIRWRLGTNPGNVGNSWHMNLFFPDTRVWPSRMAGVCPHCTPQWTPPPGLLRWDARWPSDGRPLSTESEDPISISYILSSVRDHNLYKSKYIALLKTQTEATAKALLEGCWKQFEGQFYDIWDFERMTVDPKEFDEQWWFESWISCDYGFSISVPATLRFVHTPPSIARPMGRVVLADEMDTDEIRDKSSKPLAEAIKKRWVTYQNSHGEEVAHERRWMPWYLGPDSFQNRGGQFTIAGQMNEILSPWGVQFSKARDDRQGGWMKMYNALRDGDFLISRKCRRTIEALESRVRDPERENDVLKVPGDPLDDYADACLVAGTLVTTDGGDIPIEQVATGDRVLTRKGYRRVNHSWMSHPNTPTVEVEFSDGSRLRGTGSHPVWVGGKKFTRLDALRYGYNVEACQDNLYFQKRSSSTESRSGDTRTAPASTCATITGPMAQSARKELARSIRKYGRQLTDRFRRAMTSITRMGTPCTMSLGTSNCSKVESITECTCFNGMRPIHRLPNDSWVRSATWLQRGISPQQGEDGTGRTLSVGNHQDARSAANTVQVGSTEPACSSFVQMRARVRDVGQLGLTMLRGAASFAARSSASTDLKIRNSAPVHVTKLTIGEPAAVFNIEVEGEHEYYANGILVSNCRYGYYSWATASEVGKPMRVQAEEALAKFDPTRQAIEEPKWRDRIAREGDGSNYSQSARNIIRRQR